MSQASNEFTGLPQAHVLSYVTTISTPTRVRRVAFGAVLIVGLGLTMVSFAAIGMFAMRCLEIYRLLTGPFGMAAGPMGGPPVPPPIFEVLRWATEEYFWLLLIAFPLLPSPLLIIFARSILVGRRTPCLIARYFLLVPILQLATTAAFWCGWAIISWLPLYGRWDPEELPWLAVFPFALLPILLLQDLRTFLRWIARNPATEKPPTPFLPGRPA